MGKILGLRRKTIVYNQEYLRRA